MDRRSVLRMLAVSGVLLSSLTRKALGQADAAEDASPPRRHGRGGAKPRPPLGLALRRSPAVGDRRQEPASPAQFQLARCVADRSRRHQCRALGQDRDRQARSGRHLGRASARACRHRHPGRRGLEPGSAEPRLQSLPRRSARPWRHAAASDRSRLAASSIKARRCCRSASSSPRWRRPEACPRLRSSR